MTTADHAVVRLSSPGDLLALLPYHLGYVPERSLLVVTLRGSSLFFVGRIDLPPAGVPGWEVAAAILGPLGRHSFDRAFVVTVEDALVADPGEDVAGPCRAAPRSWTDLAREVCAGLRVLGAEVDERIIVRGGSWWQPDGRPRERRPQRLPGRVDVPALAEYVGRGRVPLRHRDDLAGLVRGAPEASASAVAVDDLVTRFAEDGAERRFLRRAAAGAWARLVAEDLERAPRPPGTGSGEVPGVVPGGAPGGPDLPLLVASLHDVALRDLVLTWLCPQGTDAADPEPTELAGLAALLRSRTDDAPEGGTLEDGTVDDGPEGGPEAGHLVAVLTRLCRACPPDRGAPLLAVLGHVAWWHGDGTLARVAVDAALEQDPRYSLAVLLAQLLDLAVAPRHVA